MTRLPTRFDISRNGAMTVHAGVICGFCGQKAVQRDPGQSQVYDCDCAGPVMIRLLICGRLWDLRQDPPCLNLDNPCRNQKDLCPARCTCGSPAMLSSVDSHIFFDCGKCHKRWHIRHQKGEIVDSRQPDAVMEMAAS